MKKSTKKIINKILDWFASFQDRYQFTILPAFSIILLVITLGVAGYDPIMFKKIRWPTKCCSKGTCPCEHYDYDTKIQEMREGMSNGTPSWLDQIDMIYYINLDTRTDRKLQFLEEMDNMGVPDSKITRIAGNLKPGQGDWGCSLSHIDAIKHMIQSRYSKCIIFEDDFQFTVGSVEDLNTAFTNLADVTYDVVMLSGNEINVRPCQHNGLKRVLDAQTTSGYMVNSKFANTLLQNYQEGAKLIEESYKQGKGDHIQGPYCIDQYWKKLQPVSDWYIFSPKLGKQRDSVSDIQGGFLKMDV